PRHPRTSFPTRRSSDLARTIDASPARLASLAAVYISNGDTIQVPSVGRIYIMGQVGRTGGLAPPAGERMTLTRAIALAGGFTRQIGRAPSELQSPYDLV